MVKYRYCRTLKELESLENLIPYGADLQELKDKRDRTKNKLDLIKTKIKALKSAVKVIDVRFKKLVAKLSERVNGVLSSCEDCPKESRGECYLCYCMLDHCADYIDRGLLVINKNKEHEA